MNILLWSKLHKLHPNICSWKSDAYRRWNNCSWFYIPNYYQQLIRIFINCFKWQLFTRYSTIEGVDNKICSLVLDASKHSTRVCSFGLFVCKFLCALIAFLIALQWKCENLLSENQPKFTKTSTALRSLKAASMLTVLKFCKILVSARCSRECSFCWNVDSFQVNSQKLGVQAPQNVQFE